MVQLYNLLYWVYLYFSCRTGQQSHLSWIVLKIYIIYNALCIIFLEFFWDVAPCSHVEVDRCFSCEYCLHHHGDVLHSLHAAMKFGRDKKSENTRMRYGQQDTMFSTTNWREWILHDSKLHIAPWTTVLVDNLYISDNQESSLLRTQRFHSWLVHSGARRI
jgi:hypothetical protein